MDKILELLEVEKEYMYELGFCAEDLNGCIDDESNPFNPATYEPEFEREEDENDPSSLPNNHDLSNNPLDDTEVPYIFTHKNLPKIPYSALVNGCRGSGKSVAAQSLLKLTKQYYHKVILYSPTAELDSKWKSCFEKLGLEWKIGDTVFFEYDEIVLKKQMKKLKKINKGLNDINKKYRVLFIFDDIIDDLPKNKKKTFMNKLTLNNRHYGASLIIISQSYMLLDRKFRMNCSQLLLWKSENQEEIENYIRELSGCLGKTRKEQRENFLDLYEFATEKEHSFFYINTHQPDKKNKFHRNFDEILRFEDECEEQHETISQPIIENDIEDIEDIDEEDEVVEEETKEINTDLIDEI